MLAGVIWFGVAAMIVFLIFTIFSWYADMINRAQPLEASPGTRCEPASHEAHDQRERARSVIESSLHASQ